MKAVIDGVFSLVLTVILVMSCSVVLAEKKSLCVFDLLGANGPVYAQMKDYKIAAMAWGVAFQLKPYRSEQKASTDFKSGVCDALVLLVLRPASSAVLVTLWMPWLHYHLMHT